MAVSDAYVDVTCDVCHVVEQVRLTATAGRGWDERNVEDRLARLGWLVQGDKHYSENCRKHTDLTDGPVRPEHGADPRR